jgi:hypothetical protein
MEDTQKNSPVGRLFWVMAIVALIWNGLGAINFVQQLSEAGLSTLPPEYQVYVQTRPTWAFLAFAVSVVAGIVGAILMLIRSKISVPAFVISSLGALVVTFSTLTSGITSVIVGSALSVVLALVFVWFASRKLA